MGLKWEQRILEIASSMYLWTWLIAVRNYWAGGGHSSHCISLYGKKNMRSRASIYVFQQMFDYLQETEVALIDFLPLLCAHQSDWFFCVYFPWKGPTSIQYVMINEACRQRDSWVWALQHTSKQLPMKLTCSSCKRGFWYSLPVLHTSFSIFSTSLCCVFW